MSGEAVVTLLILGATVLLLITEWVPPGATGLCALVTLILTGVLPVQDAFAGLTNPAVITVASMYVISAAVERTGAAAATANLLTRGASPMRAYLLLLVATMVLSGFVNNTPLLLIFLPLTLGLARRLGEAPSRLLIPLSYVSILGGSATLIGTSTNLIVASSLAEASRGALELGMFDFARLGVILALAGFLLVVLLRRHLLPARPSLGLLTQRAVAVEYMTEVTVVANDRLVGRTLGEVSESDALGPGIRVLQLIRGESIRAPRSGLRLEERDQLLVKGDPEAVLQLRLAGERPGGEGERGSTVRGVGLTLFELVVTPASSWVGLSVRDVKLHDTYDASLFAVQRHGVHLREKLDELALQPGDVLLVQGTESSMHRMRDTPDALVVEGVDRIARDTKHASRAFLALGVFVALAVTGLASIEVAALAAALLAVVSGSLSMRRAYESVGWDVIFVIVGTLALGAAFVETGLASSAAQAVEEFVAPLGTRAVLGVILVFTAFLTQFLSNNATAAVMTPMAFQMGIELDAADPMPFVMAVAFGANCSFLTPVSYNTNLIVYGPGGYRFSDFLRLGLPLTLLYMTLAIVLLPLLY